MTMSPCLRLTPQQLRLTLVLMPVSALSLPCAAQAQVRQQSARSLVPSSLLDSAAHMPLCPAHCTVQCTLLPMSSLLLLPLRLVSAGCMQAVQEARAGVCAIGPETDALSFTHPLLHTLFLCPAVHTVVDNIFSAVIAAHEASAAPATPATVTQAPAAGIDTTLDHFTAYVCALSMCEESAAYCDDEPVFEAAVHQLVTQAFNNIMADEDNCITAPAATLAKDTLPSAPCHATMPATTVCSPDISSPDVRMPAHTAKQAYASAPVPSSAPSPTSLLTKTPAAALAAATAAAMPALAVHPTTLACWQQVGMQYQQAAQLAEFCCA